MKEAEKNVGTQMFPLGGHEGVAIYIYNVQQKYSLCSSALTYSGHVRRASLLQICALSIPLKIELPECHENGGINRTYLRGFSKFSFFIAALCLGAIQVNNAAADEK